MLAKCLHCRELPLMSWNGAVVVVHDGPDVRISTKYGYGASCCHGLCAVTSDNHYNDTVGLFGTMNNEPSTDTRDRNGVSTATHSFLNSFEVSGISSCQLSPVAVDSQCPDKVSTKQCMDLFALDSVMALCLPHVPDAAVLVSVQLELKWSFVVYCKGNAYYSFSWDRQHPNCSSTEVDVSELTLTRGWGPFYQKIVRSMYGANLWQTVCCLLHDK